jgi:hypothetical protein
LKPETSPQRIFHEWSGSSSHLFFSHAPSHLIIKSSLNTLSGMMGSSIRRNIAAFAGRDHSASS